MAAETLFTVSGSVGGDHSVLGSGTGDGLFNEASVTPPMIGFDATPTIGFGDDGDPSAPLHPSLLGQGATFTLGGASLFAAAGTSSTNAPANPAPIGTGNNIVSAPDANGTTASDGFLIHSDPGPSGAMGASGAGASGQGGGSTTDTIGGTSGGIVFNNTFEASVSAAYKANIISAEQTIQSLWNNNITINLDFNSQAAGTNTFLATNSLVTISRFHLCGAESSAPVVRTRCRQPTRISRVAPTGTSPGLTRGCWGSPTPRPIPTTP